MFAKQSERKNMLIYNTTYQVEEGQEDNFLIWIKEFYLPEVEKGWCIAYTAHCSCTQSP